ncbi:MAG: hypothetical protein AB1627_13520 [Chloroflexota bacterium]
MRTITALFLAASLALGACAPAATPPPSTAPTPASADPTSSPSMAPADPTAAELQLLAGIRLDLTTTCAPLRDGLAEAAAAGVECRPTSDIVDRVRLQLFDNREALLDAYEALLDANGIPPRSHEGRCLAGQPSEGGYVPGDDHGIVVAERGACYLDATAMARYVATLPPFVLVEVDGKVADVSAVERWAWLGSQGQPGSPTVWSAGGPMSPEK